MIRIGVDFGGTKIEAAALARGGEIVARKRVPNPGAYEAAVVAVRDLVRDVAGGEAHSVGIGIPGSISPRTGLIRNANSVWLNGRPFREDLQVALGQPVRLENDANCFALSEACDGAAAGAQVVFGAILGTGCGGGIAVRGQVLGGVNGIAGEWGHSPLPWPQPHEQSRCWCGRTNCLETWVSGTGFVADYQRATGRKASGAEIVASRDADARAALDRYVDRLGRGLAVICDILDPDVIVLGGGMSNVAALYERLPPIVAAHAFTDVFETGIVRALHGDSSGVRGAAWLWPLE
ncbi:MAG TPA: ROK family protein [Caulobacteraceae bacterium]